MVTRENFGLRFKWSLPVIGRAGPLALVRFALGATLPPYMEFGSSHDTPGGGLVVTHTSRVGGCERVANE
jgi:hypothetical protein